MFVHKSARDVDNLLSCLIWSHSLATGWSLTNNIIINANGVIECIKNGDLICCTHKRIRIGPIGFFLRGGVKVASQLDLHSTRHGDGRTFPDEYYIPLDLTSVNNDSCHCEVIMAPKKIYGVWVNCCAVPYYGIANKLASTLGIKLYYVRSRHNSCSYCADLFANCLDVYYGPDFRRP